MPGTTDPDTMQSTDDGRWAALQSKVNEARVLDAFRLFDSKGLHPILIKGWAAARFYPASRIRTYSDIDLGISSTEFGRAKTVLADDEVKSKFNIDLHEEFRHLDTVEWGELFEDSKLVRVGETDIRVLSEEDHLRVLCVHWLTDSGADKDRLWDIYYSVQNRYKDFDWNKCIGRVSETRQKWIIYTIGVTHKYLGLNIDDLPFADQARNPPTWFTRSLEREWRLGVPLHALYDSVHDLKAFVTQLKKRIPPNPVYSTVECEGEFDEGSRFPYQLRSLLRRVIPGIRKVLVSIRVDSRENAKRA